MVRPIFLSDEFYHVCNRGVADQNIFKDTTDRLRFLSVLSQFNTTDHVEIRRIKDLPVRKSDFRQPDEEKKLVEPVAYCLMSNHYHLILRQVRDQGITEFMRKIGTGFTHFFNLRYKKTGHLFQGKFQAQHITSADQLLWTSAYIHLNPLKKRDEGLTTLKVTEEQFNRLLEYPWSSLPEYLSRVHHIPAEIKFLRPNVKPQLVDEFFHPEGYENYLRQNWADKKSYGIHKKMA